MQATYTLGMNTAEYAYIIPWLQSGQKATIPWIGVDGETMQRVKDHYANAIIVDDVNGFDDTIVSSFVEKIQKHGMQKSDIDTVGSIIGFRVFCFFQANVNSYLSLFDSLKLYALAIRKVLNETQNEAFVTNGEYIWNRMRRMSFEGIIE